MTTARIRLIALDLDGTLVGSDLTIRPRVRDALVKARAQGVAITIVTGRMFAAAKPYALDLGVTGPVCCYQGAAIYDVASGAILQMTPVRQDVTRQVLAWAQERGIHAQCYADDTLYVQQINSFSKRYTDLARVDAHVVPSLGTMFADKPTIKIVLVDDADKASAYLDELEPMLGDRAYLTRSHPDFVEILDPNVNKGVALAFVAGKYDATLAETLAVGDAWNDLPLLKAAGIGVAMGSGPPELLSQADAVVADVAHDGVAEAVERFVLT
jgi:Cof subfamily protein (haloacid dehalogenase superfamily)